MVVRNDGIIASLANASSNDAHLVRMLVDKGSVVIAAGYPSCILTANPFQCAFLQSMNVIEKTVWSCSTEEDELLAQIDDCVANSRANVCAVGIIRRNDVPICFTLYFGCESRLISITKGSD
eukprot:TRINITY_DN12524_c0_g4_i2.p3 TRINITY_DN12524_c0_g4~~TRINITY_DN12524_c0_g4_i2.p3  ORF type:complete len:122 (-),score=7.09 TRINITY_DN12524_c0_g4_i2:2995-3360(-)